MMKSAHSIDNEDDQEVNEVDNENIVSSKLVVKQMFTESKQILDSTNISNFFISISTELIIFGLKLQKRSLKKKLKLEKKYKIGKS